MDVITTCLFLILAVVLSSWIARAIPFGIPLPIVQIAFGVGIATFTNNEVALEPHVFLAVIACLLFLDGWRIPKDDFFRDSRPILGLAVGLVFLTVVGLGYAIHWLLPVMPLPVAFALAAILAPTDPVAVSAITAKLPMPKRLLHVLEGESLLNDASGISAFRIAVAAMMTGAFSLQDAAMEFLFSALGGVAAGVVITLAILYVQRFMSRRVGEEPGLQIMISLLIPFGVYFGAEHIHVSGILAAAAAGITMSLAELRGTALAATRIRRRVVWDMLSVSINGIIFVLLGEQLPAIWTSVSTLVEGTTGGPLILILHVLAITAVLLVLRLAWIWLNLRFTTFRQRRKGEDVARLDWRIPAAATMAGVRGSVTLAGILTLPLLLPDGSPFPARDLAIFIASGVIIVTLITASVSLPILLKRLDVPVDDHEERLDAARALAARAAIRAVEEELHSQSEGRPDADLYMNAGVRVTEVYRARLDAGGFGATEAEEIRRATAVEQRLRMKALQAEREEIFRLARHRRIPDGIAQKLIRELDLAETRMTSAAL
ncbi:Na+/H+ antiporter [Falsirhodobacter sp. 1013]|uniref:Na+/H+ antiporter n=1 Tax=Falsirhodobacter sp. 1013 TaxID=3417566 RepID=UPI003EBB1C76